ncbi:TonB-dependent receptor plug domain-containing protein, partial [Hymenobacter agri]
MPRSLPLATVLLAAAAVRAQQPVDSLASRPATVVPADSSRRSICVDPVTIVEQRLPTFTTIQPALTRVAGVQVTPYSGAPGAWSTVRIRGIANVTGSSQPLYVVDGVPAYNFEVSPEIWSASEGFFRSPSTVTPHTPTANPLLDIPVEDIAQVEVLKGAAATARYGMQGTNGVILISTRRGADGGTTPQPLRVRYAGWGGV